MQTSNNIKYFGLIHQYYQMSVLSVFHPTDNSSVLAPFNEQVLAFYKTHSNLMLYVIYEVFTSSGNLALKESIEIVSQKTHKLSDISLNTLLSISINNILKLDSQDAKS